MLNVTHTTLRHNSLPVTLAIILSPLALHVVYSVLRPNPFISLVSGGLSAVIWSGVATGVTALAALRLNTPLFDATLASADNIIGLNTSVFVTWIAWRPQISQLLEIVYLSTVPLIFATVIFLAWTHRETRMWELCLSFAGSGMICALFSALLPAAGAFIHYGISRDILILLPEGSGIYYIPTFDAYRSGTLSVVDTMHLEGVVTFPSFHAAMALMLGYAVRGLRWLSVSAWIWSGLTIVSAVPNGGHYIIDLIAGAAVWVIFILPDQIRKHAPRPIVDNTITV